MDKSSVKSLNQRRYLDISGRVIKAFNEENLTRIAENLGEKPKTFWNWVKGRTKIPNATLAKIAKETGLSIEYFLNEEVDNCVESQRRTTNFDIETFGGRYRFSQSQIESLKELAEQQHVTLEEIVAIGARNALVNQGLIDDENEIELIKLHLPESTKQSESRSKIRLLKEFLRDDEVRSALREIVQEEMNLKDKTITSVEVDKYEIVENKTQEENAA